MTKEWRIAGAFLAIFGGVFPIILVVAYDVFWILCITLIAIVGGVALIEDKTWGGVLLAVLVFPGVLFDIFVYQFLFFDFEIMFLCYLLIGIGAFLGLISGPILSVAEITILDDWIDLVEEQESFEKFNVEGKIEYFGHFKGRLGFLVNFNGKYTLENVKGLIFFLETKWNRRIVVVSKSGIKEPSKYAIYRFSHGRLRCSVQELVFVE